MKNNLLSLITISLLTFFQEVQAEYTPALSYVKTSESITVNPDASQEQVYELLIQIDTQRGIDSGGQQDISYNSKLERIEIIDAYTLQKDGRKVQVPQDGIRDSADPISDGAPMFSETKHKIIIYPEVKVGSQIYYKYKSFQQTPEFEGQFMFSRFFYPHTKMKDYEINLNLSNKLPIKVESKGIEGGFVKETEERKYYHYVFNQDVAYPPESWEVDPHDFSPYVIASSFKDQVDLGRAYEKGVAPKIQVTQDVQQLADDLTKDITEPKAQVQALYNWVSKNIRYVAVYLGDGGVVPHDSDTILRNHYGDCKDHAVTLAALLKAKGIESSSALINLGDAYKLPNLAVMSPQNHVINYIPSLDIYLDSTSQFSPYGTLPFSDMDKPVILTALNKMGHTPILRAEDNSITANVEITINNDGTMLGKAESKVTGYFNDNARAHESNAQGIDDQDRVDSRLSRNGETGTGHITASDPSDLSKPFVEKTTFLLDAKSNFPGPGAITLPVGIKLNGLITLVTEKPRDVVRYPSTCSSKSFEENYTLIFPEKTKITHVPSNVDYKNARIQYKAVYSLKGNIVKVNRSFKSQHDSSVCADDFNELRKDAVSVIQRDLRSQIFYN
jgi:hypothetical protein